MTYLRYCCSLQVPYSTKTIFSNSKTRHHRDVQNFEKNCSRTFSLKINLSRCTVFYTQVDIRDFVLYTLSRTPYTYTHTESGDRERKRGLKGCRRHSRFRRGNPSTIQRLTGEGVAYPTHALVYYRGAANRKAFSNYKIIYKLRSKCVEAKGKACSDKWVLRRPMDSVRIFRASQYEWKHFVFWKCYIICYSLIAKRKGSSVVSGINNKDQQYMICRKPKLSYVKHSKETCIVFCYYIQIVFSFF